jgi:hypothetical protein
VIYRYVPLALSLLTIPLSSFRTRWNMTQLYFHCCNNEGLFMDDRGAAVANLAEARDHATNIVRALVMSPTLEDWRGWVLLVRDELGEDLFALPFASVLGQAN